MEANTKRTIKSGAEYNHLFPLATGNDIRLLRNADVADTVAFIPRAVMDTLHHTHKLAQVLKGKTLHDTCANIWHFVYDHIAYHKDKDRVEQVRSPSRAWRDRGSGVDCDCYTVFISSILTNLNIPHTYRITKYANRSYYQHIYPIVPLHNGTYITIDCVVNQFNYEEPFTHKKDTPMELHYLNGFDATNIDALALLHNETTMDDDLGKLNLKAGITKVVHVANRVNPATGVLRVGVLASMKLNLFKVAGKLRYAYMTDEQALAKGFDIDKLHKLRSILTKLENVFYGAGGTKENLKKAILTGNGNKDNSVNGLEQVDYTTLYTMDMPLTTLLSGIYADDAVYGLGALGEPITATAIAAASSAMAVIAGLIKQVGALQKDGKDAPAGDEITPTEKLTIDTSSPPTITNALNPNTDTPMLPKNTTQRTAGASDSGGASSFLDKTKAWVTEHPMQTGAVVLSAILLSVVAFKHLGKKKPKRKGLGGVRSKKHKAHNARYTQQHPHKVPIALL